jgi:hypothetical protein
MLCERYSGRLLCFSLKEAAHVILFGQKTPSTSPVYHKDLLMYVVGEKRDRAFSRKVALLYEGRVNIS